MGQMSTDRHRRETAVGGVTAPPAAPTEPCKASVITCQHDDPIHPRAERLRHTGRTNTMIQSQTIDDLAQQLAALVPPGLREVKADLTANFRSALQAGLRNLDLVTREEFDVQRCVLLRTREKIEQLEQQLAALERSLGASLSQRN